MSKMSTYCACCKTPISLPDIESELVCEECYAYCPSNAEGPCRVLANPKIADYVIKPHSNSSQICEGTYREGTSRAEVEALVKGTFGGRFEYFENGKFKYIAYTD